jgi:hypothetical protein
MLRLRRRTFEVGKKFGVPIVQGLKAINHSRHEGEVKTITDFHLADWQFDLHVFHFIENLIRCNNFFKIL